MRGNDSKRPCCLQRSTVQVTTMLVAALISAGCREGPKPGAPNTSQLAADPTPRVPSPSQLALVRLISAGASFDRPDNQGWVGANDVDLMNGGGQGRPKPSIEELALRFDQKLVDSLHKVEYAEWRIGRPPSARWDGDFTNAHMNDIAAMPGLNDIWIQAEGLTDEGLKPLARMSNLKLLMIGGNFTSDGLESISELTGLTWLAIDKPRGVPSKIDDRGMQRLKKLTNLERLFLTGPDISDDGLVVLQDMTKLEQISITHGSRVTGTGFARLDKLKSLSSIELEGTPIDDRGLESFPVFPSLWRLTLGKNIRGPGLKSLGKHPKLERVDLQECELTPSAIEDLANSNATMSSLEIPEGVVPDSGLAPLRRLKNLQAVTMIDRNGRYSKFGYPAREVKLADLKK
jgi:hypothetical protein